MYGTVFNTGTTGSLACDSFVLGAESKTDGAATNETVASVQPGALYPPAGVNPESFVHRQIKGNAAWGRGFYVRLLFDRMTIEKVVVSFDVRQPHE